MVEILDRGGLNATTVEERAHLSNCGPCRDSWAAIAAAGEVVGEGRSKSLSRGWRRVPIAAAAAMLVAVIAVVVLRSSPQATVTPKKVTAEETVRLFVEGDVKQSQWAREEVVKGGKPFLATLVKSRPKYRDSIRYAALQDLIFSLKKSRWTTQDELPILKKLETLKLDLKFKDTQLGDVVAFVRNFSGLNIVGDPGLPPEVGLKEMDMDLTGVTLRYALELLCTVGELDFDLRYGVVWVSTPDRLWPAQGPATITNAWMIQALKGEDKAVAEKLRAVRITVDMQNAPLSAIMDYVREISGISFLLEAKDAAELPLTVKLADVTLNHLLEILTLPHGLDARIEKAGVWIFEPKK